MAQQKKDGTLAPDTIEKKGGYVGSEPKTPPKPPKGPGATAPPQEQPPSKE